MTLDQMPTEIASISGGGGGGFDTSQINSGNLAFYYCSNLSSIDTSGINASGFTACNSMFCGCSSLSSVDLSMLDLSSLSGTGLSGLLGHSGVTRCILPRTQIAGSAFGLYNYAGSAKVAGNLVSPPSGIPTQGLDIPILSGSGSLGSVFQSCTQLQYVNLSLLEGYKPTTIASMFDTCSNLKAIYWPAVDTSALTQASSFIGHGPGSRFYIIWATNRETVQDVPVGWSSLFTGTTASYPVIVVRDDLLSQYRSNSNFSSAPSYTNIIALSDFVSQQPSIAAAFGL